MPIDDLGRSDHEPDPEPDVEPDPEADLPDYERELPSIPEPPEPDADPGDAPDGLVFSFWWLVLVFNAALLALSLGVLFLVVAGRVGTGTNLLFVGAVLTCYGLYRYWTNPYRDGVPQDDAGGSGDADGPEPAQESGDSDGSGPTRGSGDSEGAGPTRESGDADGAGTGDATTAGTDAGADNDARKA